MQNSINDNLLNPSPDKKTSSLVEKFVDIHCHCLAGIDDGPSEISQAVGLCMALVDDGVGTVIATPHQLGRYGDDNNAGRIREAVSVLNEELKNNDIDLSVLPGGDVRVDERVFDLIMSDEVLTLADRGKYILLELPHDVFIDIEPLLWQLTDEGISAIISHPERHRELMRNKDVLHKWLEYSCYLQVTAGSLVGFFGMDAERFGWELLSSGIVSIISTDSHNLTSRCPCMSRAFKTIKDKYSEALARLVCIENPGKVLKGQQLDFCTVVNATYVV